MKRKLLVLLCLVVLSAFVLASCDIINQNTPSGNDGGSNNTDGGTDNGGNNNGDGNGDQTDDCIHTFSEAWARNSSQHWHAATCEHTDQKSELAPHSDEDQDGLCDVCSYNVGHTHTFATEWESNELAHWHVATCNHTDEKGDYAVHTDLNANGKCDTCDAEVKLEIGEEDYGLIIEAMLAAKGGVSSGTVDLLSNVISLGEDGIAIDHAVFNYAFGSNCAYFKQQTESYRKDSNGIENSASSTWEKWQETVSQDTVFGIYKVDNGKLVMDGSATLDTLKGYYFVVSTLVGEYGVEETLYALYNLAVSDSRYGDLIWTKNDNYSYTFEFNYLQINRDVGAGEEPNVNYYELSVSFAHNENYVLTDLAIECDCYTNSLEDERDHDYTYDDTTGTITMKPEGQFAADTYVFTVHQVAGERNYVNENPRNNFLPDTFEIFADPNLTTPLGDTMTVTVGNMFTVYLGNFLPVGTSITFDPASFNAVITIDDESYVSDNGAGLLNELLYIGHTTLGEAPVVICNIHQAGEYKLTISIGSSHDKEITINVIENTAPPVLDGEVIMETEVSLKGRYTWDNMREDEVFSFTAEHTGRYIFVIPENCGAYDKSAYDVAYGTPNAIGAFIDPLAEFNYDEDGGEFEVLLEAGQTYEFYLVSYGNQTATITVRYSAQ